jgi:hypothetical protein
LFLVNLGKCQNLLKMKEIHILIWKENNYDMNLILDTLLLADFMLLHWIFNSILIIQVVDI